MESPAARNRANKDKIEQDIFDEESKFGVNAERSISDN